MCANLFKEPIGYRSFAVMDFKAAISVSPGSMSASLSSTCLFKARHVRGSSVLCWWFRKAVEMVSSSPGGMTRTEVWQGLNTADTQPCLY